jgi:hypothetical protein
MAIALDAQKSTLSKSVFFVMYAMKRWPIPHAFKRHIRKISSYYIRAALSREDRSELSLRQVLGLQSLPTAKANSSLVFYGSRHTSPTRKSENVSPDGETIAQ